jgi:threonine aldolase
MTSMLENAPLLVDLRSDTVTRPAAPMREAMAKASVGDDWYGEDPTVNRLQEAVADRLGKEAALFVPSGSMANQVALRVHCRHGDDVLVGDEAHVQWHENGAAAALAGVQLSVLGRGGLFSGADVEAAYKPDNQLYPPTRLLCVENTHNRGGGRVWPLPLLEEVCAAGRRLGLGLHLDGARLWNAEVRTGVPAATLAALFDTVAVCLSKGLGAPVGSLLAGTRETIRKARRYRQMYGGGLRQAGVLAAAGLYALEHHVERLAEDHDHARLLGERLSRLPEVRLVAEVETNIVVFDVLEPAPEAAVVVAELRERGILLNAFAKRRLRAVTHLDVDRQACERACEVLAEVLGQRGDRAS